MSASQLYAISTIAMSAYNVLAVSGEIMTATQIKEALKQQHPGLEILQLREALDKLVKLHLIIRRKRAYQSRDVQRRPIIMRDKSDVQIDPDTGEVKGGWNNWMVKDQNCGLVSVFEVTR